MEEIVKHINDTNASFRQPNAGDAKNTDLFLDNEHYFLFKDCGEQITVRYSKENLTKAILFIASILPRKFDQSATHELVKFSKEFVLDQLAIIDALFTEDGKPVDHFTQVWNARKDVPQKNGKIDKRFYFNGLLKDVLYTDYKGVQRKTKFTIRNYFAGGYSDLHILKADDGIFDIRISNAKVPTYDNKEDGLEEVAEQKKEFKCLQQIYYGAPGTGKSFEIKDTTKRYSTIRTTFHPDSDYSTFVGAYKPTMKSVDLRDLGGRVVDGLKEERITYTFVKQAFLKAYLAAWKKYAEGGETAEPQFLIIEEINRGNCAQIFGDLFQLLDRNGNGFSTYPIEADADLQKEITKAFAEEEKYKINGELSVESAVKDYTSNYGASLSEDILKGRILLLPNNLYIWATMNTSDQSLFPIDSAFKRRWDWKYVRITNGYEREEDGKRKLDENGKPIPLEWKISVNGEQYDWWQFIQAINVKIEEQSESDDKKLGYFFCNAKNKKIDAETFVGKVIFYLWNDVFKGENAEIFNIEGVGQVTFDQFYKEDETTGLTIANEHMVSLFLKKLGLSAEDDNDEGLSDNQPQKSDWKVKVNGIELTLANSIPYTTIEQYVKSHPEMTAQEVINVWEPFKKCSARKWVVANKDEIENMNPRYANYSYKINCSDGTSLWVNKDGWMHHPIVEGRRDTISEFINAVKEADLGIIITEESI